MSFYPLPSYLVDSIRPILCLQTEGAVLPVLGPTLSCHRAIQEVGSVELDSWLAGRNLQDTPTGWVTHSEMKKEIFLPDFIKDNGMCVWLCVVCVSVFVRKWLLQQTWQHAPLSWHLRVTTDRSCGQTLDLELPSAEGQSEQAFWGQTVCLPLPWSLLWID